MSTTNPPTHRCAVCPKQIGHTYLMCLPHWRLVPHELQQEVYRTWRDSRRVMGRSGYAATVFSAYLAARKQAVEEARKALGQGWRDAKTGEAL